MEGDVDQLPESSNAKASGSATLGKGLIQDRMLNMVESFGDVATTKKKRQRPHFTLLQQHAQEFRHLSALTAGFKAIDRACMTSGVAAEHEDKAAEVPFGHAGDQADRPVQLQVTSDMDLRDAVNKDTIPISHGVTVSTRTVESLFESETNTFKGGPVDQFQHLTHQAIGSTLFSRKYAETRLMHDREGQVQGLVSAIKPSSETGTLQGGQPKTFLEESFQRRRKEVSEVGFDDAPPLGDIITRHAHSIIQHSSLRARAPISPGQARTIQVKTTAGHIVQPFSLASIELFAPEAPCLRRRAVEKLSSSL